MDWPLFMEPLARDIKFSTLYFQQRRGGLYSTL